MPTDENAPLEIEPSGPPAAIDGALVKQVRDDLDELAKDYKTAAQRHLRKGGFGLVAGFFLAIVLPGIFTLMDVAFERVRVRIAPPGVSGSEADAQIAAISKRIEALKTDKADLLSKATAVRFGSVTFEKAAVLPPALPQPPTTGSLKCTIEAEGWWSFLPGPGGAFVLAGMANLPSATSTPPSLIRDGAAGQPCPVTQLDFPVGSKSGLDLNILDAILNTDHLLIAGSSGSSETGVQRLRLIACATSSFKGVAPCRYLELPEGLEPTGNYWVYAMATGLGLGLVLNGPEGVVFVDVYETEILPGQNILDALHVRRLDVDSGNRAVTQTFLKEDSLYLLEQRGGEDWVHVARIAANALQPDTRYAIDWQKIPVLTTARGIANIIDIAMIAGGRLLVLQQSGASDPLALALSGSDDLVSLRASGTTVDVNQPSSMLVWNAPESPESVFIVLGGAFSQGGIEVFAAPLEAVGNLFEPPTAGTGSEAVTKTGAMEELLFVESPPWATAAGLAPARDIPLYDQARIIGAELKIQLDAEAALTTLRADLAEAISSIETGRKKAEKQEADIALWSTIAARVIVISLILYFVQLEVSLYRYDSRLSGHYRARVLAIDYLLATGTPLNDGGFENLFSAIVAIDAREVSAKDPPRPPSDKLFEVLRDLVKARVGPG